MWTDLYPVQQGCGVFYYTTWKSICDPLSFYKFLNIEKLQAKFGENFFSLFMYFLYVMGILNKSESFRKFHFDCV